jgi:hypothetical protein
MSSVTPLGAVNRGIAAGAVGTGVMTAVQLAVIKTRGSRPSTTPAEVAKRIIRGVFQREISDEHTEVLNNAMHWVYGTTWGALYGIVQGTVHARPLRSGLVFGTVVWAVGLVELPAMQLSSPPWEWSAEDIAMDLGYHLVYGVGTGLAYAALDR